MADWKDSAACEGMIVDIFVHDPDHPKHEEWEKKAKDVCKGCPVKAECFLLGVTTGAHGVWGETWLNGDEETSKGES